MGTNLYGAALQQSVPELNLMTDYSMKYMDFKELLCRAQKALHEYEKMHSIYDTLQKCGYSEDLYQLIGAEAFLTSIHLTKRELCGKNHREIRDAFLANVGSWIKTKFKELVEYVKELIKKVIDYIYNLFLNWKNNKSAKQAMTLTSISKIPEDLECTNVFEREPFMAAMDGIRKLSGYLNNWYVNLIGSYNMLIEVSKDGNFKISHRILPLTTWDLQAAVKTFVSETSNRFYSVSGYSSNQGGGSFVFPNTNTEYPVKPYELGWTSGSMFRAASNQLNGTISALQPIIKTLTEFKNDATILATVVNSGKTFFNDSTTQQIFIADTNGLLNVTLYILGCSTVIMQGLEGYQAIYTTMMDSVFLELTKRNNTAK